MNMGKRVETMQETIQCHINEWYQIGKDTERFITQPQIIWLPQLWRGDETMPKQETPLADIKIHTKGSCSARYQTVHFGVEIVVKDVPFEEADHYQDTLQQMCFERLDEMEPKAQDMLTNLLQSGH